MNLIELFILAVGLSMDAFAVAICAGLAMAKADMRKMLTVGLYFGIFQAVMPLIGYFAATLLADKIIAYDHWIAFLLLCFLGGKMIIGSFKKEGCADRECTDDICADRTCPGGKRPDSKEAALTPAKMLPLAIATSIDALAVGVSFAFLRVSIVPAVSFIGVTTLLLSMAGVKLGNVFGSRFKSKAELAGGIILVLIGVKILLEHLGIINF
jgi:putative Mn2+ efflux pump MntP